ncbi:MAG: DMT family transporter [Tabrizicola sp.]|uniref:DMT family transporter n=1 Tax=Tabrizicola sp. TaxID=2005166 RepID=UPI002736790B|nr:DMT family transporter [Tabrizicola sp.]MDP3264938.1 DMT family transporter [Tabrizicola sp.]MDZ4068457.1 DMT family transporter [Tabrizicola sp.]
MPAQANVKVGIGLMLTGMLMFSLNDVMGKWLMGSYSVAQLMAIRSLSALVVLTPFLLRDGLARVWQADRPALQALRAGLLAVEGFGFYAAVAYLPLADVVTYWLAAPIYVAALAPLVLGERVPFAVWAAIALGFVGVVVALEPSADSLTPADGIAVLGSAAFAGAMLLGRKLRSTPDTVMVGWQIGGALIASGIILAFNTEAWQPTPPRDLMALCLLGVVAMLAHILVNRSFKHAEAAVVMPYQYSLLVWAIMFGAVFFADTPRPAMLLGAGLIVASGLFIARLNRA